jgi:hypothetical protein
MLKLTGGVYPPPHDATTYLNFAAHVDAELDIMALPGTLSTTDANAIALANREAVRLVIHSVWLAAGGTLSGAPEPLCLFNKAYYRHVEQQVKKLQAGTSYGPVAIIDIIDTSD